MPRSYSSSTTGTSIVRLVYGALLLGAVYTVTTQIGGSGSDDTLGTRQRRAVDVGTDDLANNGDINTLIEQNPMLAMSAFAVTACSNQGQGVFVTCSAPEASQCTSSDIACHCDKYPLYLIPCIQSDLITSKKCSTSQIAAVTGVFARELTTKCDALGYLESGEGGDGQGGEEPQAPKMNDGVARVGVRGVGAMVSAAMVVAMAV